jgi:hypothetical protein
VTKVLLETSDMRLIPGGDWAKVAQLPENWPSHRYQELVHVGGAPSEAVVTLRMQAAGAELVRTGDKSLAQRAGEIRMSSLDGADAPNTAPAFDQLPTPMDAEVERLGDLATHVDDFKLDGKAPSSTNASPPRPRREPAGSGRRGERAPARSRR